MWNLCSHRHSHWIRRSCCDDSLLHSWIALCPERCLTITTTAAAQVCNDNQYLYDCLQITYTFCYDFITLLVKDAQTAEFGRTEVLVEGLTRVSRLGVAVIWPLYHHNNTAQTDVIGILRTWCRLVVHTRRRFMSFQLCWKVEINYFSLSTSSQSRYIWPTFFCSYLDNYTIINFIKETDFYHQL